MFLKHVFTQVCLLDERHTAPFANIRLDWLQQTMICNVARKSFFSAEACIALNSNIIPR